MNSLKFYTETITVHKRVITRTKKIANYIANQKALQCVEREEEYRCDSYYGASLMK